MADAVPANHVRATLALSEERIAPGAHNSFVQTACDDLRHLRFTRGVGTVPFADNSYVRVTASGYTLHHDTPRATWTVSAPLDVDDLATFVRYAMAVRKSIRTASAVNA